MQCVICISGRAIYVELSAARVRGVSRDGLGGLARRRADFQDVSREWLRQAPNRSDIHESRGPKAEALECAARRKFEFDPPHVVGTTPKGIADEVLLAGVDV